MNFPLPGSYTEWQHCITEICGIPLTETFIRERLTALDDNNDHMTRKFIELYGSAHWKQTKNWFTKALKEQGEKNDPQKS